MDIDEYRDAVRSIACPAEQCGAQPAFYCSNVYGKTNPVRKPIETVHDDRCLAHWKSLIELPIVAVIERPKPELPAQQPGELCRVCGGSGSGPDRHACPRCEGHGRIQ